MSTVFFSSKGTNNWFKSVGYVGSVTTTASRKQAQTIPKQGKAVSHPNKQNWGSGPRAVTCLPLLHTITSFFHFILKSEFRKQHKNFQYILAPIIFIASQMQIQFFVLLCETEGSTLISISPFTAGMMLSFICRGAEMTDSKRGFSSWSLCPLSHCYCSTTQDTQWPSPLSKFQSHPLGQLPSKFCDTPENFSISTSLEGLNQP